MTEEIHGIDSSDGNRNWGFSMGYTQVSALTKEHSFGTVKACGEIPDTLSQAKASQL